jgi:ubiquinone/menaquinone biosynthesis C-methylase UbiE
LPHALFVGLDLFHGMLRQANAKPGVRANTGWIQADGALLPLASDTFDFVSNQFSFHHVQDKPEMIRSVSRILRPGGRFVLSNICPREMPGWLIYRIFPATWQADLDDFMAHDDIAAHMERAGFVNIQVDLNHVTSRKTWAAFAQTARRRDTCSQLITISDADYAAGLARIKAELARRADRMVDDEVCLLTIRADRTL